MVFERLNSFPNVFAMNYLPEDKHFICGSRQSTEIIGEGRRTPIVMTDESNRPTQSFCNDSLARPHIRSHAEFKEENSGKWFLSQRATLDEFVIWIAERDSVPSTESRLKLNYRKLLFTKDVTSAQLSSRCGRPRFVNSSTETLDSEI